MSFLDELKRRGVLKVGTAYLVASWVLLQITELLGDALNFPPWTITFILYLLIIGFPIALILSWMYEITPKGIRREEEDVSSQRSGIPPLVLSVVLIIVSSFGYLSFISLEEENNKNGPNNKIALAIMPLTNLSGDPAQDYFVAGMQDGLIAKFSTLSALQVTSKYSTFPYKNTTKSSLEIGNELGVSRILEGSAIRQEDRIQINVQLIDVTKAASIWADTFSAPIKDVLKLHGRIAQIAAQHLTAKQTAPDVEAALLLAPEINPDSYELYLKGMFEMNKSTPEGLQKGMKYFMDAVRLNPADPLAWVSLGNGYVIFSHSASGVRSSLLKARSAAEKATLLNPALASSYDIMSSVKLYMNWDWDGARDDFLKAQKINPSLAWSHYHYAWYLALHDRMDEAIEAHIKAKNIDPFFALYTAWLGGLYNVNEDWELAIREAQLALEINPESSDVYWTFGDAYWGLGQTDKAIENYKKLAELNPNMQWQLGRAYALLGRTDEARNIALNMEEGGLTPQEALGLLSLWSELGNIDRAIELLTYEDMHTWLPWTRVMPHFKALRKDPRYKAFLKDKLKLPPLSGESD